MPAQHHLPDSQYQAQRQRHGSCGRIPQKQGGVNRNDGAPTSSSAGKGAISLLQEFVQSSTKHSLPPNHSVLQWKFDTRMADEATLEFSATVTFLLEGVPHHAAGAWHPSKKAAQRDAAERCLRLFTGRWAEELQRRHAFSRNSIDGATAVHALEAFCQNSQHLCGGSPPKFTTAYLDSEAHWLAHAELDLMGVPHQFKGSPMTSEESACNDVAQRLLWYLQCPGFEQAFELDPMDPALVSMQIPPPADEWSRDGARSGDAIEAAKKKTAVMMVQNRLQQTFSRSLPPGQSVWDWSYEAGAEEDIWPIMYRATVHVPVVARSFIGMWARGQREAQISALTQVESFLDAQQDQKAIGQ